MTAGDLGLIRTPLQGNAAEELHDAEVAWCADNGCFSDRWEETRWWAFLRRYAYAAASCRFAVAPDVVGDAAATLARSAPWLSRIRELGYPVALVAQNGLEDLAVPWEDFDCLFIGGDTAWKLGPAARALAAEAKRRGKWVHMGRVNSGRRFEYARAIGCDSVDGTFLTFAPDTNLPRLRAWLRMTDHHHLPLELVTPTA